MYPVPPALHPAPDVTGFCRARINLDGHLLSKSYGKLTSIALDPIEKKPWPSSTLVP